jgi:hypothetical protein
VTTTSYAGASLEPETTYWWRVRANNDCGAGSFPAAFSFTTTDGSVSCSQLLLQPGFEGGPGSAWGESSSNGWTIVTGDFPRSGSYSAWLGGGNNETSAVWQSPAIPATATAASLTYWYAIISEDWCGYDDGGLEVDGVPVANHTYDLCADTATGEYVASASANLLTFAGSAPSIRFEARTDESYVSSLFIDDVVLEVCTAAAPTADIFADGFELGLTEWSRTQQ